jgi:hypothetical protein
LYRESVFCCPGSVFRDDGSACRFFAAISHWARISIRLAGERPQERSKKCPLRWPSAAALAARRASKPPNPFWAGRGERSWSQFRLDFCVLGSPAMAFDRRIAKNLDRAPKSSFQPRFGATMPVTFDAPGGFEQVVSGQSAIIRELSVQQPVLVKIAGS